MQSPSPWWSPERHADRRPMLIARNRVVSAIRGWFEARAFTEVETAALQISPGNEAHLHAFATQALSPDEALMLASCAELNATACGPHRLAKRPTTHRKTSRPTERRRNETPSQEE